MSLVDHNQCLLFASHNHLGLVIEFFVKGLIHLFDLLIELVLIDFELLLGCLFDLFSLNLHFLYLQQSSSAFSLVLKVAVLVLGLFFSCLQDAPIKSSKLVLESLSCRWIVGSFNALQKILFLLLEVPFLCSSVEVLVNLVLCLLELLLFLELQLILVDLKIVFLSLVQFRGELFFNVFTDGFFFLLDFFINQTGC